MMNLLGGLNPIELLGFFSTWGSKQIATIWLSVNEYIIYERIKKTAVKLESFEYGFSDVNYFARFFKSVEGISSTQYQEFFALSGEDINA